MLVLSRKKGQTLIIGDEIVVTILEVDGDKVKLGVEAPRSVSVYRKEVYDAIVAENKLASEMVITNVDGLNHLLLESAQKLK
jgi:carbon storage regulator